MGKIFVGNRLKFHLRRFAGIFVWEVMQYATVGPIYFPVQSRIGIDIVQEKGRPSRRRIKAANLDKQHYRVLCEKRMEKLLTEEGIEKKTNDKLQKIPCTTAEEVIGTQNAIKRGTLVN